MLKTIEHGPLAPVLTDQVIVPNELLNNLIETINSTVELVNEHARKLSELNAQLIQHTEDLSSLAKIVEEIYNET